MKITRIELFPVRSPLAAPLRWGSFEVSEKSCILVRVGTDEGVVGVGECGLSAQFYPQVTATMDVLRPLLLGQDPLCVGRLWQSMFLATHKWGRRGTETYAVSGVDIALWDIVGKVAELPICTLLGKVRESVPAYYAPDLKSAMAIVAESETAVAAGFRAIKLRTGLGLEEDLRIVREVRKAVGDATVLMVDPNMAYDLKMGLRMARAFSEFDVYWIEEPVLTHSLPAYIDALRAVSEAVSYYVAGGESLFTKYETIQLLGAGAVDVVQPDCTTVGGITEARHIASLAEALGVQFAPHVACSSIATVGLAAAMHVLGSCANADFAEFDPYMCPLREEITRTPIMPVGGELLVPTGPGLGLEIDWKAVAKYGVKA